MIQFVSTFRIPPSHISLLRSWYFSTFSPSFSFHYEGGGRAVVAQLASVRLSEREVNGLILGDFSVCFDFPWIGVAIALNIRKTEH